MTKAATFVGDKCKHGHDGLRYASTGACVACALAYQATLPPEVKKAKAAYRKAWAKQKAADPAWLEKDRLARRERSRKARERRDTDPARRAQHLQSRRDARAGAIREVEIERYLVQQVERRGGFCPKWKDPGRRGAPDRIVFLPGGVVAFVELKRGKLGEVEPWQDRYHAELRSRGQVVLVLRSHEEVDMLLRNYCGN